jgi:hypothetical protein
VEVDKVNLSTLREMLDHASGCVRGQEARLPDNKVDTDAVGDTAVCCSGPSIMQSLGLSVSDVLQTEMTLFVANNKGLTVLGAVPVEISVQPLYGGPLVKTRDRLYIVEELTYMFICRDALVDMGSISTKLGHKKKIQPNRSVHARARSRKRARAAYF